MFDLILSCCGTVKSVDLFQQARVACTQANWQAPPAQPLQRILEIVQGNFPQYDSQIAFNNFLSHLEQDDLRRNVAFALKNLVILDFIVEQRLFLSRISRYYNSQLIYMQGGQLMPNKLLGTIKDLVGSYYVYIKQKSKYYELQSKDLIGQKTRQSFMQKSNSITILNQINVCFKIQNLILDVNIKYKNGDKNSDLIQFIYSLLLRTYLFCHSIVKIALKTFAKRIPELNKYDLEYIKKFANYFKQDYLKNFSFFLSSNQNIKAFKNVEYEQMIKVDQNLVQLIETQLKLIYDDPGICPDPENIDQQKIQALAKQKQQQIIAQLKTQERKSEFQKRKQFFIQQKPDLQNFTNYVNFYSDQFVIQVDNQIDFNSFMDPAQIFMFYGCPIPQQEQQIQSQEDIQEYNLVQPQPQSQTPNFKQSEQQQISVQ